MRSTLPRRGMLRHSALLGTIVLFLAVTGLRFVAQPAQAEFTNGTLAYQTGDYERAYDEWLPLAKAGNAAAQRNIGHLHRLGRGVPKDLNVATNWYRLAADQGLSRAQANLGVMYLRGEGIERDLVKAAYWFNKAAEQGHVISQYNLALMLEQGYGIPRNMRVAARLFAQASDGGHDKAGERLAAILSETVMLAVSPRVEAAIPGVANQPARSQDYPSTPILNRHNPSPAQRRTDAAAVLPAHSLKAKVLPKFIETTLPDVLVTPVKVAAAITPPHLVARRASLAAALVVPKQSAQGLLLGEVVPVLLPREANEAVDTPRKPFLAPSDTRGSAGALPKAAKPDESPNSNAELQALIRVEVPTVFLEDVDLVGRVKRLSPLLADTDKLAKKPTAGGIPRYYQERAKLFAELEKKQNNLTPLPFLRSASIGNLGAPIQPVPAFIVMEATRATRPVQPFIHEEAALSAADSVVPGTGETGIGRLAASTTSRQTPVNAKAPRKAETASDRQAVKAGVAAYLARNYEKAISFWLPAATRGAPDAQFFVAGLFLDGNGVSRDLIQSHIWFARSADQGHQRAREQLDLLRKIMTQAQFIEAERRRKAK